MTPEKKWPESEVFVVTIDGPAGSGKSTVSQRLGERLGFNVLTTGSFYRGLAFLCQKRQTDISSVSDVVALADSDSLKIEASVNGTQTFVDGEDVSEHLRSEEVARIASQISAYPEVRERLLGPQRSFKKSPGLVAEGRDCGTVIFPDATIKIFLTASLESRASRRSNDSDATSQEHIARRDQADAGRKTAPMAKADDAVEIDTSSLSIDQVVEKIDNLVVQKGWR